MGRTDTTTEAAWEKTRPALSGGPRYSLPNRRRAGQCVCRGVQGGGRESEWPPRKRSGAPSRQEIRTPAPQLHSPTATAVRVDAAGGGGGGGAGHHTTTQAVRPHHDAGKDGDGRACATATTACLTAEGARWAPWGLSYVTHTQAGNIKWNRGANCHVGKVAL